MKASLRRRPSNSSASRIGNIHSAMTFTGNTPTHLLKKTCGPFLAAQYKDKKLTASEVDGIVANLRNTGGQNDYYALQNTFLLYRDGYDFTYSDGRDNPFRLQYIDFEHPDHNIFRCVNQFVMEQGRENRRPTFCFL